MYCNFYAQMCSPMFMQMLLIMSVRPSVSHLCMYGNLPGMRPTIIQLFGVVMIFVCICIVSHAVDHHAVLRRVAFIFAGICIAWRAIVRHPAVAQPRPQDGGADVRRRSRQAQP